VGFEVGQHMWCNIRDFKMLKKLDPRFIAKYARVTWNSFQASSQCVYVEIANKFYGTPNFPCLKVEIVFLRWKETKLEAKDAIGNRCHWE
jgi:hypothetical protein